MIGLEFGAVLAGAVVVEIVFSWPGLGRLAFDAILSRDYPLILGTTAFSAVMILLSNLLADILQALANPQVREPKDA